MLSFLTAENIKILIGCQRISKLYPINLIKKIATIVNKASVVAKNAKFGNSDSITY